MDFTKILHGTQLEKFKKKFELDCMSVIISKKRNKYQICINGNQIVKINNQSLIEEFI